MTVCADFVFKARYTTYNATFTFYGVEKWDAP